MSKKSCSISGKFRHALAELRTGHHDLEIERGRYSNIAREKDCENCVILKLRMCNMLSYTALLMMTFEVEIHLPQKFYIL